MSELPAAAAGGCVIITESLIQFGIYYSITFFRVISKRTTMLFLAFYAIYLALKCLKR